MRIRNTAGLLKPKANTGLTLPSRITNIKKDKATSNRLVENFIASKRKSK